MPDPSILVTIASIIFVFGGLILFLRIQREVQMSQKNEDFAISQSDWLLIAGTFTSLVLVILPMVAIGPESKFALRLSIAACSANTILITGYLLSILVHYRLLFGKNRLGPRENPEPLERLLIRLTIILSVLFFIIVFIKNH